MWGRGAVDEKNLVGGVLEAVSELLAEAGGSGATGATGAGWPRRTVYLALGHDEEVRSGKAGSWELGGGSCRTL